MAQDENATGEDSPASEDLKKTAPAAQKRTQKRKSAVKTASKAVQESPAKDASDSRAAAGGKQEIPLSLILGAFIVLVVLAAMVYTMGGSIGTGGSATSTLPGQKTPTSDIAEKSDVVAVAYTGRFMNGTVFDTSDGELAKASGVYNVLRTYEPMKFTLGYGGLIKGFEDAIVGMKVGQEKEVTIPPEQAYGYPKPALVQTVERYQKSPMVQNVSVSRFREDIGLDPYAGLDFTLENKTDYELTWPMKVLAVTNDTVTFRYYPTHNTTIKTVFGPADVYGVGEDIIIKVNPTVGEKILTVAGPAKILEVNEENVTMDFNHELAGKTLKFNLKLTNLIKQQ